MSDIISNALRTPEGMPGISASIKTAMQNELEYRNERV